jgi:phosphoribosyl-AMP cyclohydrolase
MFFILTSIYVKIKNSPPRRQAVCVDLCACYFIIQQKDQPSQIMLAWDDGFAVTQISDTYWAQFYYRYETRQWFWEGSHRNITHLGNAR